MDCYSTDGQGAGVTTQSLASCLVQEFDDLLVAVDMPEWFRDAVPK
jgi:hypothetical protein